MSGVHSAASVVTRHSRARDCGLLLLTTILAVAIQGYHPGLEDDAFYLAAIKRDLNPALFPHDADFFRLQFQATIFDKVIAESVRLTHLPLSVAVLLWHLGAIFLILWACLGIARRCFAGVPAQWAAVVTAAVLLTIPVAGTAISLTDQYLHPRALATAAILAAVVAVLDGRRVRAGILLAVACAMHVIMAAFGISFCIFLAWGWNGGRNADHGALGSASGEEARSEGSKFGVLLPLAAIPLGWLFEPTTEAWREAASTRHFYFLGDWQWYEWLGVVAPLVVLYCFARVARQTKAEVLERVSSRLLYYGIFQMAVALIIMLPPTLQRLRPFEPMRYLHLIYLLMFVLAGGLVGQYVLDGRAYRWALLFVPLGLGMFYAQRQMYPATSHLELPGMRASNEWVAAFEWVRANTATDALFALNPYYMRIPGEDYHGFRALAERSALADVLKDGGMAARVPSLAPRWKREVDATREWPNFKAEDFRHLKNTFGVDWVMLAKSRDRNQAEEVRRGAGDDPAAAAPLDCPYQNRSVMVCRVE
ncbi:MAG: hypothetical protein WBQ72_00675 [Terriglobales bacterium]